MIAVSNAYTELAKTNIRPKCEPVIVVSGQNENGNDISIKWTANELQELKLKRGIDPVGRELPYMELSWKELYTGNFNEENYPEKYNNVVKYMAVDLTFIQDLYFSWETAKKKEIINVPRLFLTAKPTIKGKTITWIARDILYFLESLQAKSFEANIPYRNMLRWFLLDERASLKNAKEMITAIQNTQSNLLKDSNELLLKDIAVEGSTKDILLRLGNIKSYYWNFTNNIAELKSLLSLNESLSQLPIKTVYDFTATVMYDYPALKANPTVSAYSYKQYVCELDDKNKYVLFPYETVSRKGLTFYHYAYNGLGKPTDDLFSKGLGKSTYSTSANLTVIPANLNGVEMFIKTENIGEVFTEDNRCNPYSNTDDEITDRVGCLSRYFCKGNYSAEIMSLTNLALEPSDLISVETNLFDSEKRITKFGVVLKIEIEYNGSLKQKTTVHTV